MTPSTKLLATLVATLCCTSLTLATTHARADEPDDPNDENVTANEEFDTDAEVTRDLERPPYRLDRDWHRRYGRCYSICDHQRDICQRRYFRGNDDRHLGNRHRWDWRDAYRNCQRSFDVCISICRDRRWIE